MHTNQLLLMYHWHYVFGHIGEGAPHPLIILDLLLIPIYHYEWQWIIASGLISVSTFWFLCWWRFIVNQWQQMIPAVVIAALAVAGKVLVLLWQTTNLRRMMLQKISSQFQEWPKLHKGGNQQHVGTCWKRTSIVCISLWWYCWETPWWRESLLWIKPHCKHEMPTGDPRISPEVKKAKQIYWQLQLTELAELKTGLPEKETANLSSIHSNSGRDVEDSDHVDAIIGNADTTHNPRIHHSPQQCWN